MELTALIIGIAIACEFGSISNILRVYVTGKEIPFNLDGIVGGLFIGWAIVRVLFIHA